MPDDRTEHTKQSALNLIESGGITAKGQGKFDVRGQYEVDLFIQTCRIIESDSQCPGTITKLGKPNADCYHIIAARML